MRRADQLAPVIEEVRAAGASSLQAIAAALNQRNIAAAQGKAWSAMQVKRVLDWAGEVHLSRHTCGTGSGKEFGRVASEVVVDEPHPFLDGEVGHA